MKPLLIVALMAFAGSVCFAAGEKESALPRSTPESQGVSSAKVLEFVDAADKTIEGMHSFMLIRHGQVVSEGWWTPYNAQSPHVLFSLSKSFTSTAVGLAISEGKLSLDDEVLKFFPDDAPSSPSNNLKSMRVRDLLRMSTGHSAEPQLTPTAKDPWTKIFLAQNVSFKPGTHFLYNTPATYMLSAIVQKATGMTTLDYLKPRLFEPLGIENPTWGTSPQGVSLGGYGLSVRTEDIGKFGQLYLQKGQWKGTTVIPQKWVEEATARQTSNGSNPKSDWDQGYGYQFWRARHNAYRGDGAFGQYCVVLPEQDAVIAITSGVKDMQAVLNLVWDKLLPALNPQPLPPSEDAQAKLKIRLAVLTIPVQEGSGSPATGSNKTFVFPKNERKLESLALETDEKGETVALKIRVDSVDQKIACGRGTWKKGRVALGMFPEQPAAVSGAWTGDDTYKAKIAFYESPFMIKLELKFTAGQVTLESESNVGFGPTKQPQIVGKAE